MNEFIQKRLTNLPEKPGIYLMKDDQDKIIYVGKAKNLLRRVSQYFLRPQSGKVQSMVMHTLTFDIIITNTEKEALILEMNLIHEHYPRYNILLKEGSHYPYIALRKGKDPYLKIMRTNKDKQYFYFGPYPSSRSAYRMIDLLNKIFPLRKCNVMPKAACLYFHIGQCLAPCINDIPSDVFSALATSIEKFLKGDVEEKVKEYQGKMIEASDALNFELAQEYKVILEDIAHISDKQHVEMPDKKDRDIFAFSTREGYVSLAVFVFRNGILLGKGSYVVEGFGELEEQLLQLLGQYYRQKPMPEEIIVNNDYLIQELKLLLDVPIYRADKGKLFQLMNLVQENAIQTLDDHFLTARLDDNKLGLLEELGQLIGQGTPYHIDMFDNSHLQGSEPVGAMVSFINGEPVKKMYRKFHIQSKNKQDDVQSMFEIISRRYERLLKEKEKMPDLVIVDGGLSQVQSAVKAFDHLNLKLPVIGLFKNEKHQTKGIVTDQGEVIDLTKTPRLFFFLIRVQDEVHRFAITFHKNLRSKAMSRSIFDDLPGLGPTRRALINERYASIDLLKKASLEELGQLLPKDLAKKLFEKLEKLRTS
jgi:excinuclease ABC subunit C